VRKEGKNVKKRIKGERRKYNIKKIIIQKGELLRCRDNMCKAKEDCALPRIWRFLQNGSEKSIIKEVERKDFFSRQTAIFTSFRKLL